MTKLDIAAAFCETLGTDPELSESKKDKMVAKKASRRSTAPLALRKNVKIAGHSPSKMDEIPASLDLSLMRIGTRLRHARLTRGARMKDVADAAGCSESLVSKIENNKIQPSLHVLHRLCAVMEMGLGELFNASDDDDPVVTRAGQRVVIELDVLRRANGVRMERLIPYAKGHLLQGNVHIVAPGGSSDGTISHEGEEVGYLVSGEIELIVADNTYTLGAGDSFSFRSDVPHGYRNIGNTEARIIWVNTPPTF